MILLGTLNYKYFVFNFFILVTSMLNVISELESNISMFCCLRMKLCLLSFCLSIYASSDAMHHVNRLQAEMSLCKLN